MKLYFIVDTDILSKLSAAERSNQTGPQDAPQCASHPGLLPALYSSVIYTPKESLDLELNATDSPNQAGRDLAQNPPPWLVARDPITVDQVMAHEKFPKVTRSIEPADVGDAHIVALAEELAREPACVCILSDNRTDMRRGLGTLPSEIQDRVVVGGTELILCDAATHGLIPDLIAEHVALDERDIHTKSERAAKEIDQLHTWLQTHGHSYDKGLGLHVGGQTNEPAGCGQGGGPGHEPGLGSSGQVDRFGLELGQAAQSQEASLSQSNAHDKDHGHEQ